MDWNGLSLRLEDGCDPDDNILGEVEEISDAHEAYELTTTEMCGDDGWLRAPGLRFVAVSDTLTGEIINERALRAWVEARLTADQWADLHDEAEEDEAGMAADCAEEWMRERRSM